VGTSTYSYLAGTGFLNLVSGFGSVSASSTAGADAAYLYDAAGANVFTGQGSSAALGGAGYNLWTDGFSAVFAFATAGTTDNKYIGAVDYIYQTVGNWM
jgi:hypothetical protein